MEKSLLLRKFFYFLIILFLIFPLVHIGYYIPFDTFELDSYLFNVMGGALLQAGLSTLLSLIFGFLGALGLLSLKYRVSNILFKALIILLIIPSVIPPLITILVGAKIVGFLPTGLWGVIFFHCLMNVGLVSVLLFQNIFIKAGGWLKESLVCGVSFSRFLFRGLLPGLSSDIKSLSFYFMILYFFSFSVPLMVGGSLYGGIEVFIYEKIVLFGRWGEALQYSVSLFVVLLIISLCFKGGALASSFDSDDEQRQFNLVNFSWSLIFSLWPSLMLLFGLFYIISATFFDIDFVSLLSSIQGTALISLLTGSLVFILLSLLSFCFLNKKMARFLLAMVNPGWVIVGFSFLLMVGHSDVANLLKISMALSILFLPFLFRLAFYQKLTHLSDQVQVAELFPVSWHKTFFSIIWPQCLPSICFLSGLAALWAAGDFALSGVVVGSSDLSTLALDMKSLISSYRLEQAMLLLLPLLLVSVVVFLIFQGLGYVSRRKILS